MHGVKSQYGSNEFDPDCEQQQQQQLYIFSRWRIFSNYPQVRLHAVGRLQENRRIHLWDISAENRGSDF